MFGKYNQLIDEFGHIMFAVIVVLSFYIPNLITKDEGVYIFLVSVFIDIDHLLNPYVAKLLNVEGTIIPSKKQLGYTIKILHGVDLYVLYSLIGYWVTSSIAFSVALFFGLLTHHIWDFIVYDHTWKELFLITRASNKFKPGRRKKHTGIIFTSDTLPM